MCSTWLHDARRWELSKLKIKKADNAHFLFPPLTRVASLSCSLPLVGVHLWPSHSGRQWLILHTIVGRRRDPIHAAQAGTRLVDLVDSLPNTGIAIRNYGLAWVSVG